MDFAIKNTKAYRSLRLSRFFIFKHADFFANFFLCLFIISLLFIAASFWSLTPGTPSLKASVFFICCYLVFWNVSLFSSYKIKSLDYSSPTMLSEAVALSEKFNLGEFLSLDACRIAEGAAKISAKKKISEIGTAQLFYSAIKNGKDIKLLCYRLGINVRKVEDDAKNVLEKIQKSPGPQNFSENFNKVILGAGKLAVERKKQVIGEKEILVSLARQDEFMKKVLIEYDLKETDVENLTLWLDSIERSLEKSKKFWSYENLERMGSVGEDWASGYTITLDQYSIDWRERVSKWRFKEIIGNENEIEQAQMILSRDSLSNVLLVGEAGTGRKSIVQAIAQKCYLGTSAPELVGKRVVELDMVSLLSRIQDFEVLETTLDQIFQEVLAAGNVILVIDELQNFVGEKNLRPGSADITGILSKYLPMPSFQFIGIATFDGLHKKIEQNSAFLEHFRKIEVREISEAETLQVVQNYALELESKHKILILYPSIREIVNLSGKYFPSTPFPKKSLDILEEVVVFALSKKEKIIMPHHVAEIISSKTQIPVGKMEFKEKEVLLNLENLIHKRIVNQSEAVKEISIAMRRARAGIASKKRPMGSFLFLGPTGVGKTETSKALAQIYFGSEEKMIRIDMSEFQQLSDIPRLIGAISPVEVQGLLTTPARENPFSLILLDEIEKAHPNILNLFLQVFDEGHITDGQGRKVIFTNTIIICTSNAGAETIFKKVESGQKINRQDLIGGLIQDKIFRPEFINRFDAAVVFSPLTKENLLQIAQLSLQDLQKNLKEKDIDFEITDLLKEKIVQLSYKPEFGAREMRRVIQDKVENKIAEALIADKIQKGDKIELDPETFEVMKI